MQVSQLKWKWMSCFCIDDLSVKTGTTIWDENECLRFITETDACVTLIFKQKWKTQRNRLTLILNIGGFSH